MAETAAPPRGVEGLLSPPGWPASPSPPKRTAGGLGIQAPRAQALWLAAERIPKGVRCTSAPPDPVTWGLGQEAFSPAHLGLYPSSTWLAVRPWENCSSPSGPPVCPLPSGDSGAMSFAGWRREAPCITGCQRRLVHSGGSIGAIAREARRPFCAGERRTKPAAGWGGRRLSLATPHGRSIFLASCRGPGRLSGKKHRSRVDWGFDIPSHLDKSAEHLLRAARTLPAIAQPSSRRRAQRSSLLSSRSAPRPAGTRGPLECTERQRHRGKVTLPLGRQEGHRPSSEGPEETGDRQDRRPGSP